MLEKLKRLKLETLYLLSAGILGILMVFINPPFAGVPDEHAHYWKAWSIAEGSLICTEEGVQIPKSATLLPGQIKPIAYPDIKDKKIVVAFLKQKLFEPDTDNKSRIGGANCPSTPFGYIPQVIGLRLGSLLGFSALGDLYLARVFVLITTVALMYWAIRTTPFGKIIFVLVGLLPMTIRQFASLSYDGLAIAFAAIFLAYILKLAVEKDKRLTKKDIAILIALSVIGLNVKLGYFVMAFLVFLLPRSKFRNIQQYWATMLGFVIVNLLAVKVIRSIFVVIEMPKETDPVGQLQFVLYNPFHFLSNVFDAFYNAGGPFMPYLESIIFKVGNGAALENWFYLFVFLAGLIFFKSMDEKVPLTVWQRWILFGVFVANFIIIYLALYLGWTPLGANKIAGVQGRYFLPILPVILLALYKAPFTFRQDWVRRHLNWFLVGFLIIVFWTVFWGIYQYQYLKEAEPSNPVYNEYLKTQDR